MFRDPTKPIHTLLLDSSAIPNRNFESFKAIFLPKSGIVIDDQGGDGIKTFRSRISGVVLIYSSVIDDGLILVDVPMNPDPLDKVGFRQIGIGIPGDQDSSLKRLRTCYGEAKKSDPVEISQIKDVIFSPPRQIQFLVTSKHPSTNTPPD